MSDNETAASQQAPNSAPSPAKGSSGRVKVVVRCRPYLKKELDRGEGEKEIPFILVPEEGKVELPARSENEQSQAMVFDHVYDMNSNTQDVYNEVLKDMIESTVEGYNVTTFAYGQTASGKTFTMMGTDERPGIIRLSMQTIFNYFKQNTTESRTFLVRVSYMEIYNEKVFDLLSKDHKQVKVLQDKNKNIAFDGLREEVVRDVEEVMHIIKKGENFRSVEKTFANDNSSRSHTIFRMVIERKEEFELNEEVNGKNVTKKKTIVRIGNLNLVDLAGSENASKHDSDERAREGKNINLSLLHLKNIILRLSKGQKIESFRDSKLTRILSQSLGGNARVAVLCAINPIYDNYGESKQTLHFGNCAGMIKVAPTVNSDAGSAMIVKYQQEIDALKQEMMMLREKVAQYDNEIVSKASDEIVSKASKPNSDAVTAEDIIQEINAEGSNNNEDGGEPNENLNDSLHQTINLRNSVNLDVHKLQQTMKDLNKYIISEDTLQYSESDEARLEREAMILEIEEERRHLEELLKTESENRLLREQEADEARGQREEAVFELESVRGEKDVLHGELDNMNENLPVAYQLLLADFQQLEQQRSQETHDMNETVAKLYSTLLQKDDEIKSLQKELKDNAEHTQLLEKRCAQLERRFEKMSKEKS
ncbi:kinesin-like protein [Acrasis kona]|uniref:Kinesin-like protein n=1 Tax=Acrasis kona TaxID=1008807 RepID=A0AAW2ZNW9_9EUKA